MEMAASTITIMDTSVIAAAATPLIAGRIRRVLRGSCGS
jgi:hypothetical protein